MRRRKEFIQVAKCCHSSGVEENSRVFEVQNHSKTNYCSDYLPTLYASRQDEIPARITKLDDGIILAFSPATGAPCQELSRRMSPPPWILSSFDAILTPSPMKATLLALGKFSVPRNVVFPQYLSIRGKHSLRVGQIYISRRRFSTAAIIRTPLSLSSRFFISGMPDRARFGIT